jgi:hypothetical protein
MCDCHWSDPVFHSSWSEVCDLCVRIGHGVTPKELEPCTIPADRCVANLYPGEFACQGCRNVLDSEALFSRRWVGRLGDLETIRESSFEDVPFLSRFDGSGV